MTERDRPSQPIVGHRVTVLGRLAAMTQAEFRQYLRGRGMVLVSVDNGPADWIVLGEQTLFSSQEDELQSFARELAKKQNDSPAVVLWESEFWHRMGAVAQKPGVCGLYTPGLIARLVNVPLSTVRQWYRLGLLVPCQTVHRLPYFDYQAVVRAQNLAELAKKGVSVRRIVARWKKLIEETPLLREAFKRWPFTLRWRQAFLRYGEGLLDHFGQLHFDFSEHDASELLRSSCDVATDKGMFCPEEYKPNTAENLLTLAELAEESDRFSDAIEAYRVLLFAQGPRADTCFRLAELLYRAGDLSGAKERYFMAIELDPEFAEAYLNLGSVLWEMGEKMLAVSAFQGALKIHPDYPDAHFLMAQLLEELGENERAVEHWKRFLELVPEGPWCELAQAHVQSCPTKISR